MVSREFADARENRPDARSAMNRHNNEAGRTVRTFSFSFLDLPLIFYYNEQQDGITKPKSRLVYIMKHSYLPYDSSCQGGD